MALSGVVHHESHPPPHHRPDDTDGPNQPAIPEGGDVWWYQENLGIRIPYAITGDAVTYYSELVASNAKKAFKSYGEPSSRLDYHAGVKFHKEFKLDDKTFKDVNVVSLQLRFAANFRRCKDINYMLVTRSEANEALW